MDYPNKKDISFIDIYDDEVATYPRAVTYTGTVSTDSQDSKVLIADSDGDGFTTNFVEFGNNLVGFEEIRKGYYVFNGTEIRQVKGVTPSQQAITLDAPFTTPLSGDGLYVIKPILIDKISFKNTGDTAGSVYTKASPTALSTYSSTPLKPGEVISFDNSSLTPFVVDATATTVKLSNAFFFDVTDTINASGGGTPAGSDTQIQYNNAGVFGADADLTFDPATSTFKAVTDNPLFRSTIKFSSNGGTDDLTASLATAFTGTPPTTFAVLAYGNIQIVNYINLVGGNFSQGDTITGSVSGAEGYVAYDDGVGQFYVSITNSIQFAATDVIDNANGVTADYDTSTTSDDIFFWFSTNGGSGGPIVITGTAQTLNDGIDITFGSTTGHGSGDSWEWSYKTLKNTWLTNNQAESAVRGYVNGSVYDNGSNNIVAINGLVQNGDDDRIFPLSFYQDLSSGNRNERERAYYGLDIFKGDPASPLEFVVKTQKGIGAGPGTTEISKLTVGTLSGFEFISDKSFQVSTPLFVTQGSLFSWTGDTNGNGITIDDTNNEITLQSSGVVRIGSVSGGNNTKITIDDVNEQITIGNIKAYDDDAAAGTAGLTAGMVYMTTGSGSAPLNTAGILMIKQ